LKTIVLNQTPVEKLTFSLIPQLFEENGVLKVNVEKKVPHVSQAK